MTEFQHYKEVVHTANLLNAVLIIPVITPPELMIMIHETLEKPLFIVGELKTHPIPIKAMPIFIDPYQELLRIGVENVLKAVLSYKNVPIKNEVLTKARESIKTSRELKAVIETILATSTLNEYMLSNIRMYQTLGEYS